MFFLWYLTSPGGEPHKCFPKSAFLSIYPITTVKIGKTLGLVLLEWFTYKQGSPKGVGWGYHPLPPGEGRKNLRKWLNQGFFQNIFAYLIQHGLNDSKMEFFRCRVIRWPARPPLSLPPLDPPGGRSIGEPCLYGNIIFNLSQKAN